MSKRNAQLHVEILIDNEPIMAKEFLFNLENNDLVFKSEKNQDMAGGAVSAILGSLLPLGIELFSSLLNRGRGSGIYGGAIPKKSELNKKKHDVKILDKKTKTMLKQFKTNALGGALLTDAGFFKDVLKLQNDIKGNGLYANGISAGNGLYAKGISADGVYGGQLNGCNYING